MVAIISSTMDLEQSQDSTGLPRWLSGKNLPAMQETWKAWVRSLHWEKSRGGGHGNPLQDPSLENPMDRGAWWALVHRLAKSRTWLK